MSDKLAPTFSIPGPGGSLGKCALCGEDFLKEILFGESVAMITCSCFPDQRLPMHKECADKVGPNMLGTDLPPGPLRSAFEQWKTEQPENQHGVR
jgi:hypothetical protein